jgi:hypothetical protein
VFAGLALSVLAFSSGWVLWRLPPDVALMSAGPSISGGGGIRAHE